jgi:hypothetical protein
MKQNENFDKQFGIKTSNLQSTNCMNALITNWTLND